jgi:uncharacterized protein (DUF433 family)
MNPEPVQHIEIVDGEALIAGRNLKAKLVAALYVKTGTSIDEVMAYYDLSRAQVHAALAYYDDHEDTIEQSFANAETYVREVGISADALIERLRTRK